MLNFNQPLILLHLQLAISSLLPQLNSILSPFSKVRLAHLLFHKTSVVLLVGAVVYFPNRIVLEFVLEGVPHGYVTAGLGRITAYESLAVVGEGGMLHDEPASAVAALDRHELLLDALEQFKIQKGSQRCETIGLTEYGTFFCFNYCVSHAHTATGLQIKI